VDDSNTIDVSIPCATCSGELRIGDATCPGCGRMVTDDELAALRRRWQATMPGYAMPRPVAQHGVATSASLYEPAWSKLLALRTRRQSRTGLFILGFALFALSMSGDLDAANIAILIGVILVHELGHLAAMWAFGYRDLGVFFIPFLGAVATARSAGNSKPWQRGLVTLAGPVPGIVAGWAILALAPPEGPSNHHGMVTATMLLFVNGFNLLPMMPLDGGRLLNVALFSKHWRWETTFTVCAGIGLGVIGRALSSWLIAGLGLLTAFMAFSQRRLVRAAHEIRPSFAGLDAEPATLTEERRKLLFDAAAGALGASEAGKPGGHGLSPERRAAVLASYMQFVLDRATIAPTPAATSVLLVLAYLASCTLLLPFLLAMS
jgi:Zn-dependent protease